MEEVRHTEVVVILDLVLSESLTINDDDEILTEDLIGLSMLRLIQLR